MVLNPVRIVNHLLTGMDTMVKNYRKNRMEVLFSEAKCLANSWIVRREIARMYTLNMKIRGHHTPIRTDTYTLSMVLFAHLFGIRPKTEKRRGD